MKSRRHKAINASLKRFKRSEVINSKRYGKLDSNTQLKDIELLEWLNENF